MQQDNIPVAQSASGSINQANIGHPGGVQVTICSGRATSENLAPFPLPASRAMTRLAGAGCFEEQWPVRKKESQQSSPAWSREKSLAMYAWYGSS